LDSAKSSKTIYNIETQFLGVSKTQKDSWYYFSDDWHTETGYF